MSPELAEKITDAVTRVYEACNFQDITGQRITKAVKALQHIEQKVAGLPAVFGADIAGRHPADQIGRAHVRTTITNAHIVSRLPLAKKKNIRTTETNTNA